jgi:hypothetical protein
MLDPGGFQAAFLVILLLGVAMTVVWIWALVDALRVPDDSMYRTGTKLVWVLVIVLTGAIGALIYLAIGRPANPAAAAPGPAAGPPPPPPPPL